jgi:hypothetical protein
MRRPEQGVLRTVVVAGLVATAAVACGGGGGGNETGNESSESAGGDVDVKEPELREELLEMMAADQAERTGEVSGAWHDAERTERLVEIIDEYGWPGVDLVGDDGATAAWLIAQHSDLDVDVQERALALMREAVGEDQADPTELAYLEDRVALNTGNAQVYGTQIGCVDGRAEPANLADPDAVDERRAEVGLEPLADYLASLRSACEAEAQPPAEG